MIAKTSNRLHLKMYYIRKTLNERKYSTVFSSASNIIILFFFLIRSLILRIIPRITKIYFIRKSIVNESWNVVSLPSNFMVIREYSKMIVNYVQNRCSENASVILEKYAEQLQDRFEAGFEACAIIKNDNIISIFFTCYKAWLIDEVNYLFRPDKNEICIIDIYTLKNYRNKGHYLLLLDCAINYYRSLGFTSMVMWIMKHNVATIKAQIKAGFSVIFQTVCMFSILGFHKAIIKIQNRPLAEL